MENINDNHVVAVVVKTVLALYFTRVGKKVKSDSLIATGKEAVGDIAISTATVIAAIIFLVILFSFLFPFFFHSFIL